MGFRLEIWVTDGRPLGQSPSDSVSHAPQPPAPTRERAAAGSRASILHTRAGERLVERSMLGRRAIKSANCRR